jgi:hypothetical protein
MHLKLRREGEKREEEKREEEKREEETSLYIYRGPVTCSVS